MKFIKTSHFIKLVVMVSLIFFFSIIYSWFPDEGFVGWVNISDDSMYKSATYRYFTFLKYNGTGDDLMDLQTFMKIPMAIISTSGHLAVFKAPTSTTEQYNRSGEQEKLFYMYAKKNNMITINEFISIPFIIMSPSMEKVSPKIIMTQRLAVQNWFDRLYYSVITQSAIGFGDIFPGTRMLRLVTMLQAVSTLIVLLY